MDWSIFDIIGPIMIGPSSSHTAGAAGLGHFAHLISGGDIAEVKITLYGSFARVYKGHGTDWALLGGVLGLRTDDINLSNAFKLARSKGIKYDFKYETNEKVKHPNTVKFEIKRKDGKKITVMGWSIGGGSIEIKEINGIKVSGVDGRTGKLLILGKVYKSLKGIMESAGCLNGIHKLFKNKEGRFVLAVECDEDFAKRVALTLNVAKNELNVAYFPKMNA